MMTDVAKRLCTDHEVGVAEIYSYHLVGDEFRFVLVYRAPHDSRAKAAAAKAAKAKPAARAKTKKGKARPKPAPRRAAKPARKTPAKKAARPSKRRK